MVRGLSGVAAGMQVALSPPFVLLAVLAGGAYRITGGGLAPADLLPFLLLGLGLTAPVAALGHGFDDLQAARRAVGRIRDVLAEPALPEPVRPVAPEGHRVELRGVRFGYGGAAAGREVLRGIDLVLEPDDHGRGRAVRQRQVHAGAAADAVLRPDARLRAPRRRRPA
ncbi:hypothetical protein SGRIM128S_03166 [Streptomyces griseomycini]